VSKRPTFGVWYDFRQSLPFSIPYRQFYEEALEEIVFAEQLGYSHCWTSEHHFVDDGYLPSHMAVLGAIAGRTKHIQLGTNVLLLPLHHPLRVAEDAAVLDLASGGRFTLGVGAGYVQFEFETLGVERAQRPSLMEEGVKVIRRAWDEGRIGFSGKRWQFSDLPFSPRPERRIPIYFGANAPSALTRAVRLGDGFVSGNPTNLGMVRKQYAALAEAMKTGGKTPESFPYVLSTSLYLGDTPEQAWQDVAPGIAYQLSRYIDWGTDRESPRPKPLKAADLQPENFSWIGTPQQVAENLVELYRDVPYQQVCFWARLPGLSTAQVRRNLERFQTEVVPLVEKALQTA
jgi:alkanesulfonate monooxygenase SsuD/methylene tetrahydromethanopterin reductase-like flavin-dependent oxidoreductase (luciferase family)